MLIEIHAKRWFNRSCGNTYHSVTVVVDDKIVDRCPYAYGYDNQYLQTAHKLLQKAGIYPTTGEYRNGFPIDYHNFLQDMRNDTHKFITTCYDVKRKRDL